MKKRLMNTKLRKTMHSLVFAALLGLISIPSMLGIHLLAQKTHHEKPPFQICYWIGQDRQEDHPADPFLQPFAE